MAEDLAGPAQHPAKPAEHPVKDACDKAPKPGFTLSVAPGCQ